MYLGGENNLESYLQKRKLWVTNRKGTFGYPKDPIHQAIYAVKGNEGDFSAINTYGGDILAIGIYQWTLESGGAQDLLALFKERSPQEFGRFFQVYGIDVVKKGGHHKITFLGVIMESKALEYFRNEWFAMIFSQAGDNPSFQDAQFILAEKRLQDALDFLPQSMREFNLSGEAMACILDQHVKRPATLQDILQEIGKNPKLTEKNFLNLFNQTRIKLAGDSGPRIAKIEDFFQKIRQSTPIG